MPLSSTERLVPGRVVGVGSGVEWWAGAGTFPWGLVENTPLGKCMEVSNRINNNDAASSVAMSGEERMAILKELT